MAYKNASPPRLPQPVQSIDANYMNQFIRVLNLFFTQLTNSGPINVATQNIGKSTIVAGLSFYDQSSSTTASIPTQADFANLRIGDVYCDTSAGHVLRVKVNGTYP